MLQRALIVLAFPIVACGGNVTETSDAGAKDSAPTDSTPADSRPPPGGCPSTTPSSGTKCDRDGLACEYATDPRPTCHTIATCTGGSWSVPPGVCPPLPPTTCPATRDAAAG